jgi:hypothetical protein
MPNFYNIATSITNDTILQHNNNNNIKPKLVPMPGTMEGEHQIDDMV